MKTLKLKYYQWVSVLVTLSDKITGFISKIWKSDIDFKGRKAKVVVLFSTIGLVVWLIPVLLDLNKLLGSDQFRIFWNVEEVALTGVSTPIANMIIIAAIFTILFNIIIGFIDIIFYKKITGKNFDWESMINIAFVNVIFLSLAIFSLFNPLIESGLVYYEKLIAKVPTLFELNGVVALILVCIIGDFCFYWSHRWCHNIRFFWNLGHVNHHRNRNLTSLTFGIDPQSLIVNAAGGKSFMLILLPFFLKLFSLNFLDAGWFLVVAMFFDILIDPSHSTTLYDLERKFKPLKMLRYVFVTTGVHFVHHAREKKFEIAGGCNFGSRFTIWDRLFGTYAEPPEYIPESGLFSDETDYCVNPIRYVVYPHVRMFKELKQNKIKYWPKILFGPTTYDPPVPVDISH